MTLPDESLREQLERATADPSEDLGMLDDSTKSLREVWLQWSDLLERANADLPPMPVQLAPTPRWKQALVSAKWPLAASAAAVLLVALLSVAHLRRNDPVLPTAGNDTGSLSETVAQSTIGTPSTSTVETNRLPWRDPLDEQLMEATGEVYCTWHHQGETDLILAAFSDHLAALQDEWSDDPL